ncbi:hypothetical protein Tco_1351799 [Tanacetum coccineum]
MISPEKVALEDLLKRANTEFPNDEKVIELYAKYERLFKEDVFSEDSQAHLDDFDNDDGGESDKHVSLLRRMRFKIATKIPLQDSIGCLSDGEW